MTDVKMVKRTVKFRLVDWVEPTTDPYGQPAFLTKTAALGDEIELPETEANRLAALGAFYTDAEMQAGLVPDEVQKGDATLADIDSMDVDQLASLIQEEHPSVNDLVTAADGQAGRAEKILQAEEIATGGDPRTTLTKALADIIAAEQS